MHNNFLHLFRNTPIGREALLQSIHFCTTLNLSLSIYIPKTRRFLLCCGKDNEAIAINLDDSYFISPDSAISHVAELISDAEIEVDWMTPQNDDQMGLPKIENTFDFMCCPRCVRAPLTKLRVGYIDSMVRKIINVALFPVLIPSPVYSPWKRIAVFYGGSQSALNALKLGLMIQQISDIPLDIFTQAEHRGGDNLLNSIDDPVLRNQIDKGINIWRQFKRGDFNNNIYEVAHDALVLLGGFRSQKYRNFSSKMEKIQSLLPNNLVAVGPNYSDLSTATHNGAIPAPAETVNAHCCRM